MATFSSLVTYKNISPYKYERQQKITGIIIHHMAGKMTAQQCGRVFQYAEASANYGIGYDGSVGGYVPEEYSAWSAASYYQDQRCISIELSNDSGAPDWHVSDAVIKKCIALCADICKRNGIKKLTYTGDESGNLRMHCWFAATACPGPYMKTKFGYIAEEVNKILGAVPAGTNKLNAPKLVSAYENDDGTVTIRWKPVSGAYKYRVFRKTKSAKTWTRLAVISGTAYRDVAPRQNVTYIYTVRCVDKKGDYTSSYDAKGISVTTGSRTIKVGDNVSVVKNQLYGSTATFAVYYKTYKVMELSGNRAVIGKDGVITAAVDVRNLKKA